MYIFLNDTKLTHVCPIHTMLSFIHKFYLCSDIVIGSQTKFYIRLQLRSSLRSTRRLHYDARSPSVQIRGLDILQLVDDQTLVGHLAIFYLFHCSS